MKLNPFSVVSLIIFALSLFAVCGLGLCGQDDHIMMKTQLGGVGDCEGHENNLEIESIGRFAVQEHNKKENALLEFARVVKAKEQVVAGKVYYLTLEAIDAGNKMIYEAKVWVKPWMNFKQLQEFKIAHDVPLFTTSDLGVEQDGHGQGWRTVPTHDTTVKDAAHHAVHTIQKMSNSLIPYQLLEILLAKAEVIENYVKFDLLLKVRRGSKEMKCNVLVNKNVEGKFHLFHMEQDCS
ncbi:hypothetical protein RJ639_041377 [Escallonia herrerae]|uniref:Cysteine proteinase inhibitor n=1 Tax=Escallonia herrerae TaxID=1293975 RepID=A0AA88WFY9_9ASTE|nr:hypothetical protein RJ639_041377 [Escallonia herrerae]